MNEEFFRANTPMTSETWDGNQSYPAPKLCQVLHAEHLTRVYREQGVTAYSLHPGEVAMFSLRVDVSLFLMFLFFIEQT